jgi:hypothetical protein
MNREVSLKSDLKMFNIDIDDIEFAPHFSEALQEAIAKMREETLLKNLEVVLNNNLIEARYKPTNYRTILGCRVSYADLEESVSFIVRPDEKPSYECLEQQCRKQKEVIDKAIQLLEDDNICADIRRLKPKWNENKYGVEYELLDILKEEK